MLLDLKFSVYPIEHKINKQMFIHFVHQITLELGIFLTASKLARSGPTSDIIVVGNLTFETFKLGQFPKKVFYHYF